MTDGRFIIPYDVLRQFVDGHRRKIFHDFSFWGNELIVVQDGEGVFTLNNKSFPIKRGDVFVLTGNYTKEITQAHRLSLCSVFYKDEHLRRSAASFRRLEGYQRLFVENPLAQQYETKDRLQADDDLLSDMELFLARMELEQREKEPGHEQILNSMFFVLITVISRAYSDKELFANNPPVNISKVMAYMRCHFNEKLTLESLAALAHTSPRHFDRKFKEIYDVTPQKFLRTLRMERACFLLEATDLSVTEIAMECGFSDTNYFSRLFKKEHMLEPLSYRKARLDSIEVENVPWLAPPE